MLVDEPTEFRLYCHRKWYEHVDEIMLWTQGVPDYDASYYFNKHRWMLRKMYRRSVNG